MGRAGILPLRDLCQKTSLSRFERVQALTLVETLLGHERLNAKWVPLLNAMRQTGSTRLDPHLGPILGID
ncbi:MAG: hypothetical protein JKY65_00180 [Planctomycetes bacterium]|nr:hypothetical protein [Planctomycetota bacterium]